MVKNKKCNRNKRASRLIFYRRLEGNNKTYKQQYQWRNHIHSARFLGSGIVHHRARYYAQLFRILPQTINLKKKKPHNDGHFSLLGRAHCCFLDDWCGNSIPKRKNRSATDWLFICLTAGAVEEMKFFGDERCVFMAFCASGRMACRLIIPRVSLIFGSREKKKKTTGYTYIAHSSSSHTHITTNFVRAQVRSIIIIKKTSRDFHGLARLSCCIYRSIHPHACSVCMYIQWGRDEYNNYRQSERG